MTPALVALVLATSAELDCRGLDAHGHPFRRCFDPWKGFDVGGAVMLESGRWSGALNVGLRLRGERESHSKAESTWLTLHRLATGHYEVLSGRSAFRATAYSGLFRRHVREGVILIPTSPPVSIPFPFDLTFMADVARVEHRLSEGNDWVFEPVRASMLLDPLRSASSRFHLALGVTAAWSVRQRDGVVFHEVTPLTAGTLFFDFESEDGLWLMRGTVSAGFSFIAPDTTFTFRARGDVELARVLFALNDQPLSLFVKGGGAWRDGGAQGQSEWSVQTGLSVRLFSR